MALSFGETTVVNDWVNGINNYLSGGSDSIAECSRKFTAQIEELIRPNVWTGYGAKENYKNFVDTQKSMVTFVDTFAEAFNDLMETAATEISAMDSANSLYNSEDIKISVDYTPLDAIAETNISTDSIRYDYDAISSIATELNKIQGMLETVRESIKQQIQIIGPDDSEIWGGKVAETAEDELERVFTKNMEEIEANLTICISNIDGAAENARRLDAA